MRSSVTIGSSLMLALALAPACGSSAITPTPNPIGTTAPSDGLDASAIVETGTPAFPAAPTASGAMPPEAQDAAAASMPVAPEAGAGELAPKASIDASTAVDAGEAPTGPPKTTSPSTPDAATAAGDPSEPPTSAFSCTLLIGIQATEEWYTAGFETMVDNSKWELIWVHSGFVELWANANDPVWTTAITSPCAQNPDKPDRVIFVALNYIETTLAFWTPAMTSAVANIQAKYPSVKRIELMSFIRAPGNTACPQAPAPRSTITPAQDQAAAMVAAANPGLVFVAPQFEVKTCGEYSSNPPHPTTPGATAWATMMASYYR
jgi:hypothetical protein